MMKPKKILTITLCFCSAFLFAQYHQVISTAGGSFENSSGSICFTVGEFMIATHSSTSDGIILTQGFQQSGLYIVNFQDTKIQDFEIQVYPNPVKDFVILKIEKPQGFSYTLCDMSGRMLDIGEIISTENEIRFTDYAPSIYILKLYLGEEEVAAFKIIKR